jgi:hypothetical protein
MMQTAITTILGFDQPESVGVVERVAACRVVAEAEKGLGAARIERPR